MTESPATTPIPVQLSEPEFIAFIFPHLSTPRRGPKCKLGYHCAFNLILWVLYTGMQWKCLPVPRTADGKAGIHYTTIYKVFAKWSDDGSLYKAFVASVRHLAAHGHLDLNVLHGDGTNTVAKKGGDRIGYSGHKHQKGEKILAIIDNNGFVLAPLPVAPVNEADTVLLPEGLNALKRIARLTDLRIGGHISIWIAVSTQGIIARRSSTRGSLRTSKRTRAIARPRRVDGSGCSMPPFIHYGFAWSGPLPGRINSSDCCCDSSSSSSGTTA
jgi:transposase